MVDCINESSDVTAGHTSRSQVPGAGARIASHITPSRRVSHITPCHVSPEHHCYGTTLQLNMSRISPPRCCQRGGREQWMLWWTEWFSCAAELPLPGAHCSGNPPGMKLVTHHDKGSWISNIYINRFSLSVTFYKISFVDIIILNFISVLSSDVMRLYTALTLLHEPDA